MTTKIRYRPFPAKIVREELEAIWGQIIAEELPKLQDTHLHHTVQSTSLPDLWDALSSGTNSLSENLDFLLIPKWYKLVCAFS